MEPIVNKVAESGIVTLDLANYIPKDDEIVIFDLKPFLFREMILKEKDYRAELQLHDWDQYKGKYVAMLCSVDAIIPVWAYMLAANYLQPVATYVYFGSGEDLKKKIIIKRIEAIEVTDYTDKRVVVKGCGEMNPGCGLCNYNQPAQTCGQIDNVWRAMFDGPDI